LYAVATGYYCLQVSLEGTDADGRPILLVRAAKACDLPEGRECDQAANAIVSQVRFDDFCPMSSKLGLVNVPPFLRHPDHVCQGLVATALKAATLCKSEQRVQSCCPALLFIMAS
jgi:hypothetical protein